MKRALTVFFLSLAVPLVASPAYAATQDRNPMMGDLFDELDEPEQDSDSGLVERVMKEKESKDAGEIAEKADAASDDDPARSTGASEEDGEVSSEPRPTSGPVLTVHSTAYCLTGRMASGRRVYYGAAAMNAVPLGATYRVLSGPASGRVLTIEDRIGRGSQFDIAYPGDCYSARQYGRRTISIERM